MNNNHFDKKKKDHSLTIGENGPIPVEDTILHETLTDFVHEPVLERRVHTKGWGAFGYFETLNSMSDYTMASFLQTPGTRVPTFSRFSLAVSKRGTPDTSRNVRGFSTKFYLEDQPFDLLCNHIPVFLVRDAMKFPAAIKSFGPSAKNNLSYPEMFWNFVVNNPEAMHFMTWLYSDLGTVDNLRKIRTFGVNTYVWKNAYGAKHYVKYHWIPLAGQKTIDKATSIRLAGENPDIAGQDLYDTIASGKTVQYNLCVQLLNVEDAEKVSFNVLDDTKYWDETEVPLQLVGRLTLNKNPEDYKKQVESVAFSPMNLIEGIEISNDKMLQGRTSVYWDAQRRRIGPKFRDLPINGIKHWNPKSLVTSGEDDYVVGQEKREEISNPEDFKQAGERYRSLTDIEKAHLVDNIAGDLYLLPEQTSQTVIQYIYQADNEFGHQVNEKVNWYKYHTK